jgi:uncharacterized protein
MVAMRGLVVGGVLLVLACKSTPTQDQGANHARDVGSQASIANAASESASVGFDVPALQGHVNDYAGLLTPAEELELSSLYESLEHDIGSQIAVLTVAALPGMRIEDYSLKVANAWALGRRGVDDGVLITVAVKDKALRIEVGLGLELVVSDETAAGIVAHILPEFAAGHIFDGLNYGSREIIQRIRSNQALLGKRPR